jgi:hypothetical protein
MKRSIFILAVPLLFAAARADADNFRCPNGSIVSTGDSMSEVMVKCDPPTAKVRQSDSEDTERGRVRYVDIEEWTYNEGSNTLVHYLIFRNGILVQVRTGTFGR